MINISRNYLCCLLFIVFEKNKTRIHAILKTYNYEYIISNNLSSTDFYCFSKSKEV